MTPFHCHLPLTQTSVHLLPGVKHHTRNIILVSSWKVTFRHTETLPQGCGSGLLPRWRAHRATVAVWQRCLSWQGNGQHWGRVTARHTHTHTHSPSLPFFLSFVGPLCVCVVFIWVMHTVLKSLYSLSFDLSFGLFHPNNLTLHTDCEVETNT